MSTLKNHTFTFDSTQIQANKPKYLAASNTISFGKTNKRYPSLIHVVDKIRELRAVQWANKVDKEVSTQIYYYNDHLKLSNHTPQHPSSVNSRAVSTNFAAHNFARVRIG
jgi:hypothetical protein